MTVKWNKVALWYNALLFGAIFLLILVVMLRAGFGASLYFLFIGYYFAGWFFLALDAVLLLLAYLKTRNGGYCIFSIISLIAAIVSLYQRFAAAEMPRL